METLADPFCGAGELLLEAALVSARCAPGRLRTDFTPAYRAGDCAIQGQLRRQRTHRCQGV